MDAWVSWLGTQGFLPHGYCLQWSSALLQLMVASDLAIAAAYYSIPLALVVLWRRRPDLHFGWVFGLFSLFIFSCGTTHVVSLLNIWWPLYWVEGVAKAATATVSVLTAALMWPLLPRVVQLPSTRQLEELVARLEREVHDRREAEQRLGELTQQLEQRVHERTRQLEIEVAERLRLQDADRARDVAERASRAKSEFLSRMSHEVRTPLNAVLGFAQLLQQPDPQRPAAQVQDWSRRIEQAGQHLLRLMDDVLDIGRFEAGAARAREEDVVLDEVVGECRSMVDALAQSAGVALQATLPPGLQVRTDGHRLRQVLLNLLINGVKYNRRGGSVTLTVEADGPDRLAIEVRDTGIGMNPAQLAQLFQPFNRLGRERGGPDGVGLGLVVVKNVLDLLGGSIDVSSQEQVGTRIALRWPLAAAPA